jgi:hypothetical protein
MLNIICCLSLSIAQTRITTPNPVLQFDTKYLTLENLTLQKVDSNTQNLHRYNATEKQDVPYYNIGNFGTAYYPIQFQYNRNIGFATGYNSFKLYQLQKNKLKFFDTKTPYTNLDFIFGAKEEIVGGADFSININKQVNVGLYYRRNSFKGQAQKQESVYNNLGIQQWYRSKSNRYDLKVAFLFNNVKNQENGGWAIDSIYHNDLYKGKKNKAFANVNLQKATNKYVEKEFFFVQNINLGKKERIKINDTTEQKNIIPKYTIEHHFSYKNEKYLFKIYQQDSLFFQHHYLNPDSTHDYTKSWTINNTFSFRNTNDSNNKLPFIYKTGISIDFIKYKQYTNNKNIFDLKLQAQLYSKNDSSKLLYRINTMIDISPSYIGDFEFNATIQYNINKQISINLQNLTQVSSATQKENNLLSNHFIWDNQFKKILHNKTSLGFAWQKQMLFAKVDNYFIQHFIYYDTLSIVQQHSKPINILQLCIQKDFDFKFLYFGNQFWIQYISNKNIIRLPTFAMHSTLYYKGGWISGKLKAHLGFDLRYNTNYYGNAYQPALAEFYIQQNEKLKFYPMLDLFFNLYVRRTGIFMRLEHANQGLFKQKGIYTAPNYGYLDRTFRVGVNWQFFD